MANRKYANGRTLEYAAEADCKANGYWARRLPSSKGECDVIAVKLGEVLMIQCKLDGYMPPAERVKLFNVAAIHGCVPLLASWHKEGRAARTIRYERLVTPAAMCDWIPDHAMEATR